MAVVKIRVDLAKAIKHLDSIDTTEPYDADELLEDLITLTNGRYTAGQIRRALREMQEDA